MFGYGTSWNPFVFHVLSKDGIVSTDNVCRVTIMKKDPIIYLHGLFRPQHGLEKPSIPNLCSIHLWWDNLFELLAHERTKTFVSRPCLFPHFWASISSMLGTMFHARRKERTKRFLVGVDTVKISKRESQRWDFNYLVHHQCCMLTPCRTGTCPGKNQFVLKCFQHISKRKFFL